MKLFITAVAAALAATSASADTCITSDLVTLLQNDNIDQCSSDSVYTFTSGVKPTEAVALAMCASSSCLSLLATAMAMNIAECTLPVGNKIYFHADLVDYVLGLCTSSESDEIPATSTSTSTSGSTSAAASESSSTSASTSASASSSASASGSTSASTSASASDSDSDSDSASESGSDSPTVTAVPSTPSSVPITLAPAAC